MPRTIILALFLLPAALLAEKAVGIVMYATGDRAHIQAGQSVDLQVQDLIRPGDEIETGADGKVSVQCSTGVIFQIGPESRIKVTDLVSGSAGDSIFVQMAQGSLSSIVSRENGAQNVEIRTPTAVANVRGTEFLVEAEEEETSVLVQEGEVVVEDAAGNRARARAGRFVRAHRREKLRDEVLDEVRKRRLSILAEVRDRRDKKFKERVERLRSVKERVKVKRERIKDLRERIKDTRDKRDLRDKREGREKADRPNRDRPNPRDRKR